MGLTIEDGIYDFFRERMRTSFHGKSLLMLGRQILGIDVVQYYVLAERMGIEIEDVDIQENNKSLDIHMSGGAVDSFSFFRGLGFSDIHAMDINDYEGADIIFDLNSDRLPAELHERFDYIVDGGTIEHVFHAGGGIKNIAKMLKVGGKVYHYLPATGWINHGYYTISPSLLNDFYTQNGFAVEELNIVLFNQKFEEHQKKYILPTSLEECLSTAIDYRMTNLPDAHFDLLHNYKGHLRCIAQKKEHIDPITPVQRHWYGQGHKGNGLMRGLNLFNYNKNEIAIYGMGAVAKRFLNMLIETEFPLEKLCGFFATKTKEKTYNGFPVLNILKIRQYGIKVVLIATKLFEDEIYESIKHLEKDGIKIIGLKRYSNLF